MHWKICNHYDIEIPSKWYEHKPLLSVDTQRVTTLWDLAIKTDKAIQSSRPDKVIKHKGSKTCQFIDMSVSSDSSISAKEFEKLSKVRILKLKLLRCGK